MAESEGDRGPGHIAFRHSGSRKVSDIIHELKSTVRRESHSLLSYQCSSYHSQSAFFPIIEQIKQATQITDRDTNSDKLIKLNTYFSNAVDNSRELALLAAELYHFPLKTTTNYHSSRRSK